MPQTLLALAAILAFSLFALSRSTDQAALERRAIGADVERAVTEAARNRLAEIERYAFDEQDIGDTGIRTAPSTSVLGADDGETTVAAFDDVDDFASLAAVLGGPEVRSAPVGSGTMTFELTVGVRYVVPTDPSQASAVATLAKEIVVSGREVVAPGQRLGRAPATVVLRRVVTPVTQNSVTQNPR